MTRTAADFEKRYADYIEQIAAGLDPALPEAEKQRLLEEKLNQALTGDLESIIQPEVKEIEELLQAAEQADAVNQVPVAQGSAPTNELPAQELADIRKALETA